MKQIRHLQRARRLLGSEGFLVVSLSFSLVVVTSFSFPVPPSLTEPFPASSRTRLFRSSSTVQCNLATFGTETADRLTSLLENHGYGNRLVTLSPSQLPKIAEVYDSKKSKLCRITALHHPTDSSSTELPRVEVESLASDDDFHSIVDIGQVTSIWNETNDPSVVNVLQSWKDITETNKLQFDGDDVDKALDQLYWSRVGRSRSSKTPLTKKKVSQLAQTFPLELQSHVEGLLRRVLKAGVAFSRLVDSSQAADYMFNKNCRRTKALVRRAVASCALASDVELGGRFKRVPCMFVSSTVQDGIIVVNGGWLVVDQSVRAGTEARKFVEKTGGQQQYWTIADRRILQRMECLAMGELFAGNSDFKTPSDSTDRDVELDVREALKQLGLSITPEGATEALLQSGQWSRPNDVRFDPWSESILNSARWYAEMDNQRRKQLFDNSRFKSGGSNFLEGRVDLTNLPCVCVDARRTSFRDDAIGIRKRASTGRKVTTDASQWEILIHIADVSDIYAPENGLDDADDCIQHLKQAAESRGMSRYDLPLGPLHLMPPTVLKPLALETIDFVPSATNIGTKGVNRCVTIWAYIDERTGKLLDAGLERTLISFPVALSFDDATLLLEKQARTSAEPMSGKLQSLLGVMSRILSRWSDYHHSRNSVAQKREKRLFAREAVANQVSLGANQRDDGRDGFQRTRGHRLVDSALDLHAYTMEGLLRRSKAPVPRISSPSRGNRVATAPLRRYLDGMAQRQALAVLCGYGGKPLTKRECAKAGSVAAKVQATIWNIRSLRQGKQQSILAQDREAVMSLKRLVKNKDQMLSAISTGQENYIVVSGVGAIAKCHGVKGSLKPGERLLVRVNDIDVERGIVTAQFVDKDYDEV